MVHCLPFSPIPMIRLAVPDIDEAEVAAAAEVLRSGMLVQGDRVRAFEARVASAAGTAHAVAVSSGTAALHLALLALGVGPGAEVVLPGFTHPATANVVARLGAEPVLVDIDPQTLNVDPRAMVDAIGSRTRALLPVHLFGLPAEMGPILEAASARGVPVVEDAACALGAEYRGRKCGSLANVACFSFHPRKIVTTGEGGMLTTDDPALAERLRRLRNHGQVIEAGRGRFLEAGLNYRLTEMQAAIGLVQMDKLERLLGHRATLALAYEARLSAVPGLRRPPMPAHLRAAWQAYVVTLPPGADRDVVQSRLKDEGVEATLGTYALAEQPCYAGRVDLPQSRAAQERTLALPLHTRMGEDEVDRVVDALRAALGTA